MLKRLLHPFRAHPATVDETYLEHLVFAGRAGFTLLGAACAAFVHALLPFLCERTASNTIIAMHARMSDRRQHDAARARSDMRVSGA